ncbi:hypothetical protein NQ318_014423 [Aromia moschata]|uniref:non-specific protein-tyrosine kinase n=1 Tax=Aromia moschata TaxID=1265417 RepID=A0AAV8Y686_9CUCU|nr:hypothetical protein NQ318_014423 [Aromia moschata]
MVTLHIFQLYGSTTKLCPCYSDVSPAPPVNQGSPVRCTPARTNMESPKKSPQNSPATADKATVKVHLPNGGFNVVRYGDTIDIKGIISTVTERLSTGERYYNGLYAMRLSRPPSNEVHWLHQDITMQQVHEKYLKKHPNSEWRYDLRVRYLPTSLKELYEKDKVTFHYYYDQVRNDYHTELHKKVDQDVAVQLCCLEIRKYFKDMPQNVLDKKSNFEYLEREIGMQKFIPNSILEKMKSKFLRKSIQTQFKKFAHLTDLDSMFKFLEILKYHTLFDQERFRVDFGSSFTVPVELVIGPDIGISHTNVQASATKKIADFDQIQAIQTLVSDCEEHTKATLQLRVAGTQEVLFFTCPNLDVAESLADLIDGYCRLHSGSQASIWNRKGRVVQSQDDSSEISAAHREECSNIQAPANRLQCGNNFLVLVKTRTHPNISPAKENFSNPTGTMLSEDYAEIVEEGDYSVPAAKNYELDRSQIELHEILGRANSETFIRGTVRGKDGILIPVAVKTCKGDADLATTEKFLEEASVDSSSFVPLEVQGAISQTYIVAQNPEVLAHLMKENETRGYSPAAYNTPASVFNTLDPEVPENVVAADQAQKSGTLERTPSLSSTGSTTPKMDSLERKSVENSSPKLNSLERNAHLVHSSHSSLDKSGVFSPKLGSLERKSRNTSPKMGSLERNNGQPATFSPKMGSLDRNVSHQILYDPDSIPNYHAVPVMYQFVEKPKEFEESIYDFGGVDVKSCAHKQQFFVQKATAVPVDNKAQEQRQQVRIRAWLGCECFLWPGSYIYAPWQHVDPINFESLQVMSGHEFETKRHTTLPPTGVESEEPTSSQHSIYGDQLLKNLRYDSSSNFNYELKQKLRQQQLESEEDSKWLAESEIHLWPNSIPKEDHFLPISTAKTEGDGGIGLQKKRLSVCVPPLDHENAQDNSNSLPSLPTSPSYVNNTNAISCQLSNMTLSGNGNGIHSSTGSVSSSKSHSPLGSLTGIMAGKSEANSMPHSGSECSDSEKTKETAQNPTANLDRTHDRVYECTTDVVRAVMALSQGVQQAAAEQYLDLVKKVGLELRSLLASVDAIVTEFPSSTQREVEMAHKVLSKDMAELVNAMKLAQQYSNTTLDAEYRKGMLAAAHVLAMDSKNLLDVVDTIRIKYPQINKSIFKSNDSLPESDESHGSLEKHDFPKPTTETSSTYPHPSSPTPVSCTFVPMYSNNVQSASSSNLSTNQVGDS